jgi:hypothetical protein
MSLMTCPFRCFNGMPPLTGRLCRQTQAASLGQFLIVLNRGGTLASLLRCPNDSIPNAPEDCRTAGFRPAYVRFSIGAGWCQALSDCSVDPGFDATRRVLASLRDRHFGPPMMGSGGCGGPISRYVLAVRATAGIRLETDSPHPSSLRGHRSTDRRNSGFLLVFYCAHLAMRRRHDECHKCASTDGRSCLLGRAERSSPKAAQRRATGAGLDGERAHRAIIRAVAMRIII